jgi:hypothetical protein
LDRLVTQTLLAVLEPSVRWGLALHLQDRFPQREQAIPKSQNLHTDQPATQQPSLVTPKLTKLTDHQRNILTLCEAPRSQAALMKTFGLFHRAFFKRTHLDPLIKANLVRMTHPDEPHHPSQAYVVTEDGLGILTSWKKRLELEGKAW